MVRQFCSQLAERPIAPAQALLSPSSLFLSIRQQTGLWFGEQ
jgi:hypothetical protein